MESIKLSVQTDHKFLTRASIFCRCVTNVKTLVEPSCFKNKLVTSEIAVISTQMGRGGFAGPDRWIQRRSRLILTQSNLFRNLFAGQSCVRSDHWCVVRDRKTHES